VSLVLLRRLAAVAACLCLAAILVGSLAPAADVEVLTLWDKLQHALAYFAFAGAWCAAGRLQPRRLAQVVLSAALIGGLVELVQPSFGRDASVFDLLADLIGAAAGAPVAILAVRVLARRGADLP
jgi:VanZ family protein